MPVKSTLRVGDRDVAVSNLDKVLYPAVGFTKADVIRYYGEVSPYLLPHLKGRAVTLKRYPDGVDGPHFYEKNCPVHRPGWLKTEDVETGSKPIRYCLLEDLPSLVWAAQIADLEIHTFLAPAKQPDRPRMAVFDLDPGAPADIVQCCLVAGWVREKLREMGLECLAKTSGSKGLQLYVPLNTPATFEKTKNFAHTLARTIEHEHPGAVVSRMGKHLRHGKVFIDWSQNDEHKTTVSVYSLRAREQPTVSTPVTWEEVEQCLRKKDASRLVFTSEMVLKRTAKLGDLFAPLLTLKQRLPKVAAYVDAR